MTSSFIMATGMSPNEALLDYHEDIIGDASPMTCIYFQPQLYVPMLLLWYVRHLGFKRTNRNLKVLKQVQRTLFLQYLWEESKRSKTQFKKRNLRQIKKVLVNTGWHGKEEYALDAGFKASKYYTNQQPLNSWILNDFNPENLVAIPEVYNGKPFMPPLKTIYPW